MRFTVYSVVSGISNYNWGSLVAVFIYKHSIRNTALFTVVTSI